MSIKTAVALSTAMLLSPIVLPTYAVTSSAYTLPSASGSTIELTEDQALFWNLKTTTKTPSTGWFTEEPSIEASAKIVAPLGTTLIPEQDKTYYEIYINGLPMMEDVDGIQVPRKFSFNSDTSEILSLSGLLQEGTNTVQLKGQATFTKEVEVETETPETETPETETPETETPETETPSGGGEGEEGTSEGETETPGAYEGSEGTEETPETGGTTETETPGTETPGTPGSGTTTETVTVVEKDLVSEVLTINYDSAAPTLSSAVLTPEGDTTMRANEGKETFYVSGPVNLSVSSEMSGPSGISEYILYKDGTVSASSSTGNFRIQETGTYSVSAVAGNGKTTPISPIGSLMDPSSFSSIIMLNEEPSVRIINTDGALTVVDGKSWFKDSISAKVEYNQVGGEESSFLDQLKVFLNGEEVANDSETASSQLVTITAPESSVESFTVKGVATDLSGRTVENEETYWSDTQAPTFGSGKIDAGANFTKDGITYITSSGIVVSGDVSDGDGSGIDSVELLREAEDGSLVSVAVISVDSTGKFSKNIDSSGTYYLRSTDKVGNVSQISLSGLTNGTISDTINTVEADQIVTTSLSLTSGGVDVNGKNWYASLPSADYSVNGAADGSLIKAYTVYVNGVIVSSGEGAMAGTVDLASAIDKIGVSDSGAVTVKVEAESRLSTDKVVSETTVYLDDTAPEITNFNITIPGSEGKDIGGGEEYGIYLKGATSVYATVQDAAPSSGLKSVTYTLRSSSGEEEQVTAPAIDGRAKIDIPANFKGYLSATAQDNVSNTSAVARPSGIISGPNNWHINNTDIDITLSNTPYSSADGLPLYSGSSSAAVSLSGSRYGVKSVSWGLGTPGDNVLGSESVSFAGDASGVFSAITKDKNLVNAMSGSLSLNQEGNNQTIWVRTVDRAGFESTSFANFSIDMTAPTIAVSYSSNNDSGFYNSDRTAEITITDSNFTPDGVDIRGKMGTIGSWTQISENTWQSVMSFTEDGEYQFQVEATDRAGNKSAVFTSETFTIDKTAPVVSVSWDIPDGGTGTGTGGENFFNQTRTATVTVEEHNFDPALVEKTGSGTLSSWSRVGDTNTATVTFDEDGSQEFGISVSDKAGNKSNDYTSGKFYIHKGEPTVEVKGVSAGTSYHRAVSAEVDIKDKFLLPPEVVVTDSAGNEIEVEGTLSDGQAVYTMAELPKEQEYDGLYTLTVTAENKAGSKTVKEVPFIVNRFGSQFTFANQDYLGKYHNKASDITINEYSVEPLDLENTELEVSRNSGTVEVKEGQTETENTSKGNYEHIFKKDIFQEDGVYNLSVFSSTSDGTLDSSTVALGYDFVLDTTPPTVIVSGVKTGGSYNTAEQKGTVEIRDAYGLSETQVLVNGVPADPISGEAGMYSFTLNEGSGQEIRITAVDMAGNVTEETVDNIVVTTNYWEYFKHTTMGKIIQWTGIFALVALVIGAGTVVVKKIRRNKKDEVWRTEVISASGSLVDTPEQGTEQKEKVSSTK